MLFENLSKKMTKIFRKLGGKGKLTELDLKEAVREIKLALLEADVNYMVVKEFVNSLTEKVVGVEILKSLTPTQQIVEIVKQELEGLMSNDEKNSKIIFPSKPPCIIMMCGLQGSGKTTHSAKIAKYFLKKGHKPLLVACDVYRPAAIEQLKVVGESAGVDVFELGEKKPLEIAKKALEHAKDYGHDLIILDTAGRLHIDDELMKELEEIKKELNVNETLFVVDAMTGQDIFNIANTFNEKVDFSGIVITKLDGDARGGVALSLLYEVKKPVKFIGTGEKLDDLEIFDSERMSSRILGMGDVLTLVEKAKENVKTKDLKKMAEKIQKNKFDMDDLLNQMKQIKKLGSIKSILGMIPGFAGKIKDEQLEKGEEKILKIESIIHSMTKKEKQNPLIIDYSRKKRISLGSGTTIFDVNQLLKQFIQMKKIFKKLKNRKGNFKNMMPFLKN